MSRGQFAERVGVLGFRATHRLTETYEADPHTFDVMVLSNGAGYTEAEWLVKARHGVCDPRWELRGGLWFSRGCQACDLAVEPL